VWYPLLLLALCAVLLFWRLGVTPLDDFDEAYYAEGAREMLERGDLGTPYFNGKPFLLKPILIYWLIAAAFRFFGITEFAARSVSAFFATVIVLTTYWFATRALSRSAGLLAGLMLALCYLWVDTGREAMIDMPLTAALAGAMFLFFIATRAEQDRRASLYLTAYALLGVALLAKGPAATGVAVLGLIAYLLHAGRLRQTLVESRALLGIALMLVVAAPWYVYEGLRQPGFVHTFLISEHFGHLQGELARDEPWWGHLRNLLAGFYPWVAFVPAAMAHAFRQPRDHVLRFAAWWALTAIVAFSFAGAKLPHYLVPAFPALAIGTAAWSVAWMQGRPVSRPLTAVVFAFLGLTAAVLALAFGLAVVMPPAISERLTARYGSWTPGPAAIVILGALAVGSAAAAASAALGHRRAVFALLAAAVGAAALAHIGWFKLRLAQIQAQPRKELAQFAAGALPEYEPLGVYYAKRNATIFYARRPIVDLGESEVAELIHFISSPSPATALTHAKFVPVLVQEVPELHVWTRRGDFVLVSNHPLGRLWTSPHATPSPLTSGIPTPPAPGASPG
jgi:hypothetical protein